MKYSFFGSFVANGINPTDWLNEVLEKIADTKLSELANLSHTKENFPI